MAQHSKRLQVAILATGIGVIAPLAMTGGAAASSSAHPGAPTVHGTIHGFSTGDFLFADALSTTSLNVAQASVAQSAAGVANNGLTTTDHLGQSLLTSGKAAGHQAYARGAGASVNLGSPDKSDPKVQLTDAEAVSAPPQSKTTKQVLNVPLNPLAAVDVLPDTAQSNLPANGDFCVLGQPISEGTGAAANADVLQAAGVQLVGANGTVRSDSTEELDPNGHGALGLNSVATLNIAGVNILNGLIKIKVVNPLLLDAFAGGVPGTSKVTFGSNDGSKDLLSLTVDGTTTKLTVDQLLGKGGLTIKLPGLLNIQIGAKPTVKTSANGQTASIMGDLVSIQVLGTTTTGKSSVGGPLGGLLTPVVSTLESALNTITTTLGKTLTGLGLSKAVDLRIGHFEATAQVPNGGIKCQIPVKKTANKNPVTAGDNFTVTISAHNPYACTIKGVRVDDHITATGGVKWTVGATRPTASKKSNTEVIWNNIGNIAPGQTKQVQVDIGINSDSAAGTMSDTSKMTGKCATGNAQGTSTVNLAGKFTLHQPRINPSSSPGPGLPNTGMNPLLPVGGGLVLMAGIGIAVARRRGVI